LAKNDIHSRLEIQIFMHFQNAFKISVIGNQNLKQEEGAQWQEIAYEQIYRMLKGKEIFNEVMNLAINIELEKELKRRVTLTEVIGMKQYCGLYFQTLAARQQSNDNDLLLQPNALS